MLGWAWWAGGCVHGAERRLVAVDVGGTWFRTAIVEPDLTVSQMRRWPAETRRTHPDATPQELQERLVLRIVERSEELLDHLGDAPRRVAISLGAAIDQRNGLVLGSGPLWGDAKSTFDLAAELRRRLPDVAFTVVNDVTAMLLRHVHGADLDGARRVALVTVSSGIGARTYDRVRHEVPLGTAHGLQGEIGHVPVECSFRGHPLRLTCDCGGAGHLNAFASGRGIERVMAAVAEAHPVDWSQSLLSEGGRSVDARALSDAVEAADPLALEILKAVTRPLALALIWMLTADAQIDAVILTGSVVHGLHPSYLESLLRQLEDIGLYQVSDRDRSFLRDGIVVGAPDDLSGLVGAAIQARRSPGAAFEDRDARWRVVSALAVDYEVREVEGVLRPDMPALMETVDLEFGESRRRLVVVDERVDELYGEAIRRYFEAHGATADVAPVAVGEDTKTMDVVLHLADRFARFRLDRRHEPVIAIGGGVLLDVVGLSASLYKRGVPYVRVPTTLMAYIDAGIGVKTAVNLHEHKSRLGSYCPPVATLLDRWFLQTLDERHVVNGLAEIVKLAVVADRELFELIEGEGRALVDGRLQRAGADRELLRKAVGGMLSQLAPNLWERDLNRLVDFGHTFSPRVEMALLPELLHGEAVAIDIAVSTTIAADRGLLARSDAMRVLAVLEELTLPLMHPDCTTEMLVEGLRATTVHRAGRQRAPLPVGLGAATFVSDIASSELTRARESLLERLALV